jgi:hypothetical protein
MPITPFHFCPGVLLKAAATDRMSWTVFVLANYLIDLEPVTLFLVSGEPAHQWLHTLPGAVLVAAVAATLGRPLCELWLRWWNRNLSGAQARWLGCGTVIGKKSAWVGALLGTGTHLALDMFMHADVRPAWPFFADNPFAGSIPVETLQWGALAALLPALAIFLLRQRRAQ